jgi:hypothetical protein
VQRILHSGSIREWNKRSKENIMAAVTYTKGDWHVEADIQPVSRGKYQGIVLIKRDHGAEDDASEFTVEAVSNTPAEALEEAKALAHRILSER